MKNLLKVLLKGINVSYNTYNILPNRDLTWLGNFFLKMSCKRRMIVINGLDLINPYFSILQIIRETFFLSRNM